MVCRSTEQLLDLFKTTTGLSAISTGTSAPKSLYFPAEVIAQNKAQLMHKHEDFCHFSVKNG